MANPSNAANGLPKRGKKKGLDESHGSRGPLHFGKLTKRLESEMEALHPAYNALSNISNLFQEYRSEVEVFEHNFDTMKAKDDQIRDLNAAMRLWKSTGDEEVETLKGELESMEEDRKKFQEERQQFEKTRDRKMQDLIQNEEKLAEKDNRLKDGYEQKLKKTRDLMKAETHETILQLRAVNEKISKEIADLKAELAGAYKMITDEKKDWSIVRSALNEENRTFRKEMESLKNEFAIEARPDDF